MRLNRPTFNGPEQGMIFRCGFSERYPDTDVYGIVITARCDLAQQKVDVHNYVPVIPLADWLRHEFFDILARRETQGIRAELSQVLSEAELSDTILDSQPPRAVLDQLLSPDVTKLGKKRAKRFETATKKHELLRSLSPPISKSNLEDLCNAFSGSAKQILRELVTQRLAEYYFLAEIDCSTPSPRPGVARLREVVSIPADVMITINQGLPQDDFQELLKRRPSLKSKLSYATSDFAEPVGTLRSPDIEHFLQQFSGLFGRIGIEDHPTDTVNIIASAHIGVEL